MADDGGPVNLAAYRDSCQHHAEVALLQLYAGVLNKPLERRELTPEQRARREARLAARHRPRLV
jgi:hypothetical protein